MAEIKKLTDGQKEALRLLGWAPDAFQSTVQAIVNKKTTKAFSTSKDKNAQFYARAGRVATIQEVVSKLTPPVIVWLPLGYCYFVRLARCKNCGCSSACLDSSSLYLVQTNKAGSTTRRYTAVTEIAYPQLPRWTKEVSCETLYCMDCYDLTNLAPEEQGATSCTG